MWLMLLRSTGPSPTCSRIGSNMLVSTPSSTLPGSSATVDWPIERMLTRRLPGQARLDRDPGVLLEPDGQVGRDRQSDPGPERPVDLGQGHGDHPARLDPGDPDLAARPDALAVAEVDVDLAAIGQEARARRRPSPSRPIRAARATTTTRPTRISRPEDRALIGVPSPKGLRGRVWPKDQRPRMSTSARPTGARINPSAGSAPSGRRPARRGRPAGTSRR